MKVSQSLQSCRRDRRELLEFLFSSGLIKEIRTLSGDTTSISNVNLDCISTDYVIESIKSGGVLDMSIATRMYHEDFAQPMMINLESGDFYFLLTDPESAGSPPQRMPPPIPSKLPNHSGYQGVSESGISNMAGYDDLTVTFSDHTDAVEIQGLGLPDLRTGLLEDELRVSAYEVCLACMTFSGFDIYSVDHIKKEKNPRFLSGLKGIKGKKYQRSKSPERERHIELLDTIRMQMQISEAMDAFARRRLAQFSSVKAWGQINIPEISLGLLNGTFRTDFPNEKSYTQWKSRQADILEESISFASDMTEKRIVCTLLGKIRKPEEWEKKLSPSDRTEVLLALRQSFSGLSSKPGRFGIQGETYYWTSSYHLNIRLYEKLLFGLFDILEDGQLMEETEELLKILKLTWSLLGITPKLHSALFGWALFAQFVETEEPMLLDYAIREMQRVLSVDSDPEEDEYISSLTCLAAHGGSEVKLNLVQSAFLSISSCCDSKLQDYHINFSQKPSLFKEVMTMALLVGIFEIDASGNFKFIKSDDLGDITSRKVKEYVERSLEAAFKKVIGNVYSRSEGQKSYPLAVIADTLRIIAEREHSVYFPFLRQWYPEAGAVASTRLHRFYGERLRPFLRDVSGLSGDVRVVLPAAYMLENSLTKIYYSASRENGFNQQFGEVFVHYQIGEISRPIILVWIIAQHARIMEWTGRAFDLENWGTLSHQQKQAASAVEVFRIIEETVDQLFSLRLPMDITHLQALLSIVFHTLDAYLQKIASGLVEKKNLYPPIPPLTRYKEATFPIIKKKLTESTVLDNAFGNKLDELTTAKLCVRLNTLQYIQKQMSALEDGIKKSWTSAGPSENHGHAYEGSPQTSGRNLEAYGESIDELFAATFDCISDTAARTIRHICEFIGVRVVFLDLRETFLYRLYHGGVDSTRLDSVLGPLDTALNHVCGLVDDTLRDLVVSSIFRASLEGYVWVLLDGGPSRAFLDTDIPMMEDDLNMLKDLFIADGEGLPRTLVEQEAKFAHQILSLFSLQAESVIQLLMSSTNNISIGLGTHKYGQRCLGDADALIRVLCHKKDKEASKFLKQQYQLPASSEYDEVQGENSSFKLPLVTDLRRTASSRWGDKGSSSFISLKKKLQLHWA